MDSSISPSWHLRTYRRQVYTPCGQSVRLLNLNPLPLLASVLRNEQSPFVRHWQPLKLRFARVRLTVNTGRSSEVVGDVQFEL